MQAPNPPSNERERLKALQRYNLLDTPMEKEFEQIVELAAHIADVPIALVSLVDVDRQWFKARYGLQATETPRDVSFCGHVVETGEPLVIRNSLTDVRFADNPLATGEPHVEFYAGMPLRTPDGYTLGTLCAIDTKPRDLSPQQHKMLLVLADQVVRLLEQRRHILTLERYRLLLDSRALMPFVLDTEGHIQDATRTLVTLHGTPSQDLIGQSIVTLSHEDDRPAVRRYLESVMRQSSAPSLTVRMLGTQESPKWLCWTAIFHPEENAIYALARDVTAEQELTRSKYEFLAMVSHDIRTPLTSISASLSLLQSGIGGQLSTDASQLVGVAKGGCERLVALVSQLLDLDRLNTSNMAMNTQPVALQALLQGAVNALQGFAHHHQVTIDVTPTDLAVMADSLRVGQVLTNLLSNAIKFSPTGASVKVSGQITGAYARIEVTDIGPGIAPDKLHHVFLRYAQASAPQLHSSGLGLTLAKQIVEALDGSIGVDSEPGAGASFWFTLPLA